MFVFRQQFEQQGLKQVESEDLAVLKIFFYVDGAPTGHGGNH